MNIIYKIFSIQYFIGHKLTIGPNLNIALDIIGYPKKAHHPTARKQNNLLSKKHVLSNPI